ncbi:hypothetical protein BDF21DRAFT_464923 [Thamnidium elegans]|uniref:Uncharacterized protein n=1 Tax=Thamnidium elegans TaxID=101142 RepID=A0A8H7SQX9_9FUNG|nr:hypothetical protein INT48_003177 [Thamnidium elegans]KAI8075741.1 hypothetical protein BDF21DRAFT_464923 [Thamnidium elegans]
MNSTASYLDNDIHYEANRPKLQWLIILIPIVGAFAIYTFVRIRNKAKAQQQLDEEEMFTPLRISNIIPAPSPIFHRQMYDVRSNERAPLIQLSNIGSTIFWHRLQPSNGPRDSTPPPVYSVSSPPKYDEVIALENESPTPN